MFVISRKRINLIIFAVILSVFGFIYSKQEIIQQDSEIEVTATPSSGKVVVLDAGHGTPDEGEFLLTLTKMTNLIQQNKVFRHFIFLS